MGGSSKGGGGGRQDPIYQPIMLTDPIDGTTFMQYTDPASQMEYNQGKRPTAQSQLNEHIANRKAKELETSNQAKATADQTKLTTTNTFNDKRTGAVNAARDIIAQQFYDAGADPAQYSKQIEGQLQRQYNTIPQDDPNPQSAFPSSLGDTILNSVLGTKRQGATDALSGLFGPTYSQTALPSTALDPHVNEVVAGQFDPLGKQLEASFKRGRLNDSGYSAAQKALADKRQSATAQVRTIGEGILGSDRSALDDYITEGKNKAANLSFRDTFDPSVYGNEAARRAQQELGSLGGELKGATAGTSYANISDLLNVGGSAQGSANLPGQAANQNSPGYIAQSILNDQKRGLGNTGAF